MLSHTQKDSGTSHQQRSGPASQMVAQAKLTIGKSNDRYEQEADKVADKVVSQGAVPQQIQTKCAACGQEEKVQRKGEEEEIQTKPISLIQRQDEEEIQAKPMNLVQKEEKEELQMKSAEGPQVAPAHISKQIEQSKGNGSPLPSPIKSQMESGIGADFSQVRVHTGAEAENMSQSLNAQAFTVGNDIYFNKGKYIPGSSSGKHLLAHELTHTVQQGSSQQLRRQQVPATVSPAQTTINQHTGRWGLDETALASHLYQQFTASSSNLASILQVMDTLSAGSRDNVAYELIHPLSQSQLNTLASTDEGRQFLARMRDYMDDGYVSSGTQTEINRINTTGQAVTTPSTGMPTKTLNVTILEYDGYSLNTSAFEQATNLIFQQCAINVQFNSISVNLADTHSDLGGNNELQLDTGGATSESNNVLARAGVSGNTIVAAMVEDIKVNNLRGFAGFTPPRAGLVAISNRSNQTHTLAHEIGHFLGLSHLQTSSRLMYGNNNTTSASTGLTPWESSVLRSKI